MNYAQAAEIIKGTVSTKDVVGMLGYNIRRGGFMVCPFHGDTDASLKVYDGKGGHTGWHCFGCGKGGSCIDFVMESEGCNFSKAVRIINDGMNLNLLTVDDMFSQNTQKKIRKATDMVVKAFDDYLDCVDATIDRMLQFDTKWLLELEAKPTRERTAIEWTRIQLLLEEMQYFDYMLERTEELRKEVSAWRSKARNGTSP